ncbi:MAG: GAF domain-containing protein, partial [Anaerolineae bacterium]
KKILLVEDHDAMRQITRQWLEEQFPHCVVHEAGSVCQALNLLAELSPDVVLLDIGLPDGSGLNILRQRRNLDRAAVIILTNEDAAAFRQQAEQMGVWGYVLKKHIREQLPALLRSALSSDEIVVPDTSRPFSPMLPQSKMEEELLSILDGVRDAILVERTDGKILYANRAACEMYGYGRDELLRKTVFDLVPSSARLVLPEGEDSVLPDVPLETVNRRADGSTFPVEITVRMQSFRGERVMLVVVRDITARKQAEGRQKRTLHELEVLHRLASTVMYARSEEELLEKVTALLQRELYADHIGFLLWDAQAGSLRVHPSYRGIPDSLRATCLPVSQGVVGQVYRTGRPAIVSDVRRHENYYPATEGSLSEICVPLKTDSEILGVLNAESKQVDAFSEADLRFLTIVAGETAAALLKMRYLRRVETQAKDLNALAEISTCLRRARTQDEMAAVLLEQAVRRMDAAAGVLFLLDADRRALVARAWHPPDEPLTPVRQSLTTGINGHVMASGEMHFSENLAADPLLSLQGEEERYVQRVAANLALPLRTSEDERVGVMHIGLRESRRFTPDEIRLLQSIAEIGGNAFQRAASTEAMQREIEKLAALRRIDEAIMSNYELPLTLETILGEVVSTTGVDAAVVWLAYPGLDTVKPAAQHGLNVRLSENHYFPLQHSPCLQVISRRDKVRLYDLRRVSLPAWMEELQRQDGLIGYLGLPLIARGQVVGVLEVYQRQPLNLNSAAVEFLEALAGQTAIAIENIRLVRRLQHANTELMMAYDATVEGWGKALELRDEETENHTRRVTELTVRLARWMGVEKDQIVHIRRGALLHDIGKLGVPDAILNKAGPLNEEEWEIMRRHPLLARDLIAPIAFLRPALDIPYSHHEKWDGSGYPQGLKGEEIPLAARIFAVVDVWDALNSDRPYRKAWPRERIVQLIREEAGRHFDPRVAEAFLAMLEAEKDEGV